MGVLDGTEILLGGEVYKLLREDLANRLSKRRWQVEKKRTASTRIPRADTRPGEIDGDFIVTWRDWSKGICGDHENLVGCMHYGEGAHGLTPGALRPAWTENYAGTSEITTDQEWPPCKILEHGMKTYLVMGRYVYTLFDTVVATERDLGANFQATDATTHNGEIVVASINPTTNVHLLQKRSSAGVWTTSADASALTLGNVENRLWRGKMTNAVSNIGPTDNPLTNLSWSADITVGNEMDAGPQALLGYGERLAVLSAMGIHLGDRNAIFPNVLPQGGVQSWDNGRRGIARGADIFYPHKRGLIRYDGSSNEEVGLGRSFSSANTADQLPGLRFTALCHDGYYLWGATAASGFPAADPTGIRFTQNNGAAYTNLTANLTDSDAGTTETLTGWDILANGDYLLVGFSQPFYGIYFDMDVPNRSIPVVTAAYVTAAGPPVTATTLPVVSALTHETARRLAYEFAGFLFYSGALAWTDRGSDLAGWVPTTVDGTNAYWMRLSLSTASTTMRIREVRVLTANHRAHVFRGRPWRPGDVRESSIIWESYSYLHGAAFPRAIASVSHESDPHSLSGALIALSKQRVYQLRRDYEPHTPGIMDYPGGGRIISAKHDGGSPEISKQWLSLVVKGRTLDANHPVTLEYRLDEASAWTTAGTATASPTTLTLTGATGYAFQWRLTFNAFRSDTVSEANEVEVVYRELYDWKAEGTYLLELYDGSTASEGGMLPDSDVQLTRLEALHGGAAVQLRDATSRLQTVNVTGMRQLEVFQEALDYPVLAVEIRVVEA